MDIETRTVILDTASVYYKLAHKARDRRHQRYLIETAGRIGAARTITDITGLLFNQSHPEEQTRHEKKVYHPAIT